VISKLWGPKDGGRGAGCDHSGREEGVGSVGREDIFEELAIEVKAAPLRLHTEEPTAPRVIYDWFGL
jgi:hypothetical protein